MPVEIESTLTVGPTTPMPDLSALGGVTSVEVAAESLEARYLDTPGLTLLGAGITLRRRSGGHDEGWHLKLPLRDGARHEVHLPLGEGDAVPAGLRRVVAGTSGGEELVPVAVLRTERTAHRVLDDDGVVLAEVADDRVTSEVTGPDGVLTIEEWREWEVELVDGGEDVVAAAGALLADAGARPSEHPSKLARVLGERVPETLLPVPEVPGRDASAGQVVLARIAIQVAELVRVDPLVRAEVPDAVHRARVSTRRLRSALATFGPVLTGPVPDHLRQELKWFAGVLGEARDAEVLRRRLTASVDGLDGATVRGDVRSAVDDRLAEAHRLAVVRVEEAMASPRYAALRTSLVSLATDAPSSDLADRPAAEMLPERVRREWKRLRRRAGRLDDAGVDRDHGLHEVRKAAKRARYAAETLVPVIGKPARRFAKAAKRVQSTLGDHQDTVVARDRLHRLADAEHAAGRDTFTLGVLHAREVERAEQAEARFAPAWSRLQRRKVRTWLAS